MPDETRRPGLRNNFVEKNQQGAEQGEKTKLKEIGSPKKSGRQVPPWRPERSCYYFVLLSKTRPGMRAEQVFWGKMARYPDGAAEEEREA
jgi:hypothetical protein